MSDAVLSPFGGAINIPPPMKSPTATAKTHTEASLFGSRINDGQASPTTASTNTRTENNMSNTPTNRGAT